MNWCFTALSERRKVLLFGAVYDFLCMKYLRELPNRFAPNWHRRRVWSLARATLKVKVKVTRDKTAFSALLAAFVRFIFR